MAAGEYERQIRPQVSKVAVPDIRGSAVGEGLQALGQGITRAAETVADTNEAVRQSEYRIAQEQRRRDDAHSATVWSGQNADAEVQLQQKLTDLRNQSKPGAVDHMDSVNQTLNEWTANQIGSIPATADPEVRDRLTLLVQKSAARYRSDETGWATTQRYQYEGQQAEKFSGLIGRDAYAGLSGPGVDVAFTKIDAFTDNLDMAGNAREQLNQKLKRQYVIDGLTGMQDRSEDERLRATLALPQLADYLDAKDVSTFGRAASAIGKSREAQAAQAQTDLQGIARDQINALRIRMEAGDVPTTAEFRAVQASAVAAGLPVDDQTRIGVMATQGDASRQFQTMDAPTRRRALDGFQALIADGSATAEQRIAAKSLQPMVDRDEKEQAEHLRSLIGQGVPGRVQALASIQGDGETRFNVAEKLQKGWGVLTTMSPNIQKAAFEGWQVRKDHPKDFGTEAEIRRDFGGFVGGAIGGQWGDYMQAAWNAYAADMNATGDHGYNADRFRTIVRYVTGARQRSNGVMEGGINLVRGKSVHLPDFMTASEFDTALSRMTFGAAIGPDGQPARKADILANLTPRFVGDDADGNPTYQWVDSRGRALRANGGRVFTATFSQGGTKSTGRWQDQYAVPDWQAKLTKLSPSEERDFQAWAQRTGAPITDDYDMRGFWKSGGSTSVNRNDGLPHYTDEFKTPLHKSFSGESRYADKAKHPPKWNDRDQLVAKDGTVLFDERKR